MVRASCWLTNHFNSFIHFLFFAYYYYFCLFAYYYSWCAKFVASLARRKKAPIFMLLLSKTMLDLNWFVLNKCLIFIWFCKFWINCLILSRFIFWFLQYITMTCSKAKDSIYFVIAVKRSTFLRFIVCDTAPKT